MMPITRPKLPPKEGYIEVEVNGQRQYRAVSPSASEPAPEYAAYSDLAAAIREGVNSV